MASLLLAGTAFASDHNNIDSGRPLRFEDAYSIAYGERTFEFGLFGTGFRHNAPAYGAAFEFKHGFALNQEWGISYSPTFSGRERFDEVELSYLQALRREIGDAPALAYRLNVGFDEDKVEGRIRGIATKALGQYDKLHLNLDFDFTEDQRPGFAAILGYSTPLGYPRHFDQTLVAEILMERRGGDDWTGAVGLGLRRQLDPVSTFDFGLEAGFNGGATLRIGYARSF
jgi:hypothetical protein